MNSSRYCAPASLGDIVVVNGTVGVVTGVRHILANADDDLCTNRIVQIEIYSVDGGCVYESLGWKNPDAVSDAPYVICNALLEARAARVASAVAICNADVLVRDYEKSATENEGD